MTWLLLGLGVWIVVAIPAALLIGRGIRVADARHAAEAATPAGPENFVATDTPPAQVLPTQWTGPETVPGPPPAPAPRRRPVVVREPVSRTERDPSTRDSGVR